MFLIATCALFIWAIAILNQNRPAPTDWTALAANHRLAFRKSSSVSTSITQPTSAIGHSAAPHVRTTNAAPCGPVNRTSSSRHRAANYTVAAHRRQRAGRTRRAAPGLHHGNQRHRVASATPGRRIAQHLRVQTFHLKHAGQMGTCRQFCESAMLLFEGRSRPWQTGKPL